MATIHAKRLSGSYLTHHLPSDMHADIITARLGFSPSSHVEKGTAEWEGEIDGQPFGIWDFKGARWSVYAPGFTASRLREVFPELMP